MIIGIITISYNQSAFLGEAMASVAVTDTSRLNYVIVDPGSKDGSRELIQAQRERFSKIIFEPDKGPADGLNKGFAACDADIYGYLNSDDRFAPGALDWVLDFFEKNPDVDVVMGAGRVINEKGTRARIRSSIPCAFDNRAVLNGTTNIVQQATFFRKRAWHLTHGFNPENRTSWDWELLADMLMGGAHFKVVYKVLGEFRLHGCGLSGSGSFSPGGKLYDALNADAERIGAKLQQRGVKKDGVLLRKLFRMLHKVNPLRRARELWTR